jgi:hypothetical protein
VANRLKEALWNGAWDFHMNGIAPPPLDFWERREVRARICKE